PSNNKKKSLKDIKAKDVVHPYSRKAMQIRRAHTRMDKLARGQTMRVTSRSLEAERYLWFRYAMDEERDTLTLSELHELMESYIARNDEEIQTLKDSRRKGQPPPKKLQMLETLRKQNQSEYANGMIIPDLTDKATVAYIR
ncbi:translation machinery-associated protein 16, partial [Dimargaris xerosporica]